MKRIIFLATFFLASCSSSPQQSKPQMADKATEAPPAATAAPAPEFPTLSCSKGKEVRTLAVSKKGNGCTLAYTKNGKTNEAASSAHGTKHCTDSQKKVQSTLEGAGFKCT